MRDDETLADGSSLTMARDNGTLLVALRMVDVQGWDGPVATTLLRFVREQICRPLAVSVGLRGAAAAQAEASAWQAAWLAMTKPSLRHAASPWGVLWRAAKRAVLGEVVAARYGKSERRAWDLYRAGNDRQPVCLPLSLDVLLTSGWEPQDPERPEEIDLGCMCEVAVAALVDVGWAPAAAVRIVAAVVELPDPANDPRSGALGWRTMAASLDLPPWQARRLCVALRGTASWTGLFARALQEGASAASSAEMRAALRATRVRRHRSPALAAQRAATERA